MKCHSCQSELDEQSLAAGKCSECGAPLRNLPKRNIDDQTHTFDEGERPFKPEVPDHPTSPGAQTIALPGDQTISLDDEHATVVPPGSLIPNDPTATKESLPEKRTETPPRQTPADTPPRDPHATSAGPEAQVPSESAEKPSPKKGQATVAFSPDQTIDFTGGVSGDDVDSLVTANWETRLEGDPKDSHGTVKQKETLTGQPGTKSSIVVKSRQFHSGPATSDQLISPSDAPDYELLNIIGEGGMGVVYAARQSAIARTVAVKMLKKGDSESTEQREKFISEAVVTGELDHPNIVPIYDLGSNDSGALFYSMKRVKGTPWNKVIAEKSLDENLNILLRVADAVAFAHANGVVHRDLKPENTMLGDYGEVLVMDWGLARISPDFPNASSVSQSDVMGGTPAYMAPEMATGPIDKVTIASDIYLLGAMLYEIIEGKTPHSGSTVMACLFAAAKNKITPPQQPGELSDIAFKAMATDPADRYATVRLFQDAVRDYQSHSESIVLTESAASSLTEASKLNDYDLYSRAMYGFQEALSMWSGNHRAKNLLSESRAAYATAALGRGDFELGLSLLDPQDVEHSAVISKLEAGRKERESRKRRITFLKRAVVALIAAVIAIIGYSYREVSKQRDIAIEARGIAEQERDNAETQRLRAEREKERAVVAEADAVKQKDLAVAAEAEAVKQKDIAVAAEEEAVRQRDIAKEQRELAVEARRREEYEAYVAQIGLANAKIEENAFDRAHQLLVECSAELSQWEWGRLAYLCQLSKASWQLTAPVEAVAYSPDGKYFASADRAGNLTLRNVQTGAELFSLTHGQYVYDVAFDRAGGRLASASSDQTVRIHSVPAGKLLQEFKGHTDGVVSVGFSHDGTRLVSGSFDNVAIVWDSASGKPLQQLKAHSWWVRSAQFSADDNRIVTCGEDGKAIVWQYSAEAQRFERHTEFDKHRGPINAAQFSPNGNLVASAGADGRVLIWNPDQVKPVDIKLRIDDQPDPPAPFVALSGHDKPVWSLSFSPDGKRLASGGEDNVIRIWDLTTSEQTAALRGHTSYVYDCQFSPDGNDILSAGRDEQIKLWNPASYGEALTLGRNAGGQHADAVLAARFSHDGTRIITASRDRTARIWDAKTQELIQEFAEGHDFLATNAVFFAGGNRVATSAGDGTTRIWNVAEGTEITSLVGTGRTAVLDVSADNRWLATAGIENDVQVWDLISGKRVANLRGHTDAVTAVCFANNGKMLASADQLGFCRTWQLEDDSWQPGLELRGHSRTVTALKFSEPNRLVSASGDNTCAQWNLDTGQEISELVLKHPGWITAMDVTEDGTLAITICEDGLLRLWSLAEARMIQSIQPRKNVLFTSVDISPTGKMVAAACAAESSVQLWRLDTGKKSPTVASPGSISETVAECCGRPNSLPRETGC